MERKHETMRFEFYWSRQKVTLISAGLVVVLAVGVPMLLAADSDAKIFGGLWIGLFGALLALLILRARSAEPVIVVDERGLLDRRICQTPLPWAGITGLDRVEAEHMNFLGLRVTGDAQRLAATHRLTRWMRWPNKLMGFPEVSISMHTLDGSLELLVAAIGHYRPDLVQAMRD